MADHLVNATTRPGNTGQGQATDLARTAVQALLKARKLSRMYPPGHPGYKQGVDPLLASLEQFFVQEDALVLQIKHNAMLWENQVVYQEAAREGNLAFFLHKDGIRALSFHRGITREELHEFLLVLQADLYIKYGEDDVVTLMWEKDVEHIRYVVVEDWDTDEAAMEKAQPKPVTGTPLPEVQTQALSEEPASRPSTEALEQTPDFAGLTLSPKPLRGIFTLNEDEVRAIKQQILEEQQVARLHRVVEILMEILYQERGTPEFTETLEILRKAADQALLRGDFAVLTTVLQTAREMAEESQTFSSREQDAFRRLIRTLSSPERFQDIRSRVVANPPEDLEGLQTFLQALDTSATARVMGLLDLPEMSLRRAVTNALVNMGKRDPAPLLQGLEDSRWYIVRGVIYVLGRLGWSGTIQALETILKHPESRVRVEAIRSLGLIGSQEAGKLILRLLDDSDSQVRITAIRYLSNVREKTVLDALKQRIGRRAFQGLPVEEKRATFETLGELGGEAVLPLFQDILQRRGWVKHANPEEVRACAVAGLEAVGTPASQALIQDAQQDPSALVQRACREALKRRQKED